MVAPPVLRGRQCGIHVPRTHPHMTGLMENQCLKRKTYHPPSYFPFEEANTVIARYAQLAIQRGVAWVKNSKHRYLRPKSLRSWANRQRTLRTYMRTWWATTQNCASTAGLMQYCTSYSVLHPLHPWPSVGGCRSLYLRYPHFGFLWYLPCMFPLFYNGA